MIYNCTWGDFDNVIMGMEIVNFTPRGRFLPV